MSYIVQQPYLLESTKSHPSIYVGTKSVHLPKPETLRVVALVEHYLSRNPYLQGALFLSVLVVNWLMNV